MRYMVALAIIASAVIACNQPVKGRNGVSYKTAVQYNDYIVGRQKTVIKNMIEFGKVYGNDPDSAYRLLDKYEPEVDTIITEIKGMPAYKMDSALRDAAVALFIFYKKLCNDSYRRILDLRSGTGNTTGDAGTEVNGIIEEITKEEEKLDKTMHNAQQEFARNNKMKLMDNKMQKKLNEQTGQ